MQQIQTTKGGVVIFDKADWKAGLGAGGKFNSAVTYKKAVDNGFQTIEAIDPFSSYGNLSPAYNSSANATNNSGLAGTLLAFEPQDNSNTYGIDSGGKVHSANYGAAVGVINASPHTITGTTPVAQDCLIYRRRASATTYTTSLFYSYYNTTNWNVGCITDATLAWASVTFDDTFMSGTASPALDVASASPADGKSVDQRTMPHPLCIGSDDVLYIGSGRYLHAYDGDTGTQGSFTSRVLTLPAGSQIIGMRKFNDLLLIVVNYYSTSALTGVGQAFLYSWNYRDADVTDIVPLEDNYVSSIFMWGGTPAVITNGITERNGNIKVKLISGNSVRKVADFDGIPPLMRGVVVANDVLYMNCGGEIVAIGDRFSETRGLHPTNHIGSFRSAGVSGGMFYDAGTTSNLVLWGGTSASTTYTLTSVSGSNGHGDGNCRTFSYFPTFPTGKIGKITSVTIQYGKTLIAGGTNGTFSLFLFPDDLVTYTIINAISSVSNPLTKKNLHGLTDVVYPQFNSFELYFQWVAGTGGLSPTVSRVMVEYDHVDISA